MTASNFQPRNRQDQRDSPDIRAVWGWVTAACREVILGPDRIWMGSQLSLLGRESPAIDPQLPGLVRRELGAGAWIEYSERCLRGHATLLEELERDIPWQETTQHLYDREV